MQRNEFKYANHFMIYHEYEYREYAKYFMIDYKYTLQNILNWNQRTESIETLHICPFEIKIAEIKLWQNQDINCNSLFEFGVHLMGLAFRITGFVYVTV